MVRNYQRKTQDRWTKDDLLEALTSIKECKLKVNEAASRYRISRATLYRQFKKFLQAGGKCDANMFRTCGGNPILTKVEEDVLEKTIKDLREQQFTVTSADIKQICFEYCSANGIPNQFNQEKRMASDDWYYSFVKRHPDVKMDISKTETVEHPMELCELKMDIPEGKKKLRKKRAGPKKSGGVTKRRRTEGVTAEFVLAESSPSNDSVHSPSKLETATSSKHYQLRQRGEVDAGETALVTSSTSSSEDDNMTGEMISSNEEGFDSNNDQTSSSE